MAKSADFEVAVDIYTVEEGDLRGSRFDRASGMRGTLYWIGCSMFIFGM